MKTLNFESLISEIFVELKLTPRKGQLEAIDSVLTSFFIDDEKRVVLNAPTGYGKSIIAIVISKAISKIKNAESNSLILMNTNVLVDQYVNSFSHLPGFYSIRGAEHYTCKFFKNSANHCCKKLLDVKAKEKSRDAEHAKVLLDHCENVCEYKVSRRIAKESEILVTNNTYHFIMELYAKVLNPALKTYPKRDLMIFDEAHLLNDSFVSHMQVHVTKDIINAIHSDMNLQKISSYNKNECTNLILDFNKVTETDYKEYFKKLMNYYLYITKIFDTRSKAAFEKGEMQKYVKLNSLYKKYFGLHCKIDDLFKYNYEHVIGVTSESIDIKPVFMRDLFHKVAKSEFQLYMSATIEPTLFKYAFGTSKFKYIKLAPIFTKDQKKVTFLNVNSLNHSNMTPNMLDNLSKCCEEIVKAQKQKAGLILCPSFSVTKIISEYLKSRKNNKLKIFEHIQGENISGVMHDFKSYKGDKIFITPSGFEGLDLKDNESRFQIIVKAPFYSLGDKRIKYILDKYPKIYKLMTLYKIIQGLGRSTRNEQDYSHTYCLDTNIYSVFNAIENVWYDEFQIC